MRTIPPALAARLEGSATTLCRCWALRRRDGFVLGFTDHDRDLVVDGVTCRAGGGWSPGASEAGVGYAPGQAAALGRASPEIQPLLPDLRRLLRSVNAEDAHPDDPWAEHLLTRRAVSQQVADKLIRRIRWWEAYTAKNEGSMDNNPSPGNKAGGLTTILEKSLGAVAKGGTTNLVDVYEYAEPVTAKGFVYMDTPGYDPVSATGQVAGGAKGSTWRWLSMPAKASPSSAKVPGPRVLKARTPPGASTRAASASPSFQTGGGVVRSGGALATTAGAAVAK